MTRRRAADSIRRLLALVPWVAAHDRVRVDEVCERFGIDRAALLADLEVLWFVGTPPYSPDSLMEVEVDDDWLRIRYAAFDQPLRLTPEQAVALVAAATSLSGLPGGESGGALDRALVKLQATLDVPTEALGVSLGAASQATVAEVHDAIASERAVALDYYSYSRDERGWRTVDPWAIGVERGEWYLTGWCHLAAAPRTFRLDRVHGVQPAGPRTHGPPPDHVFRLFAGAELPIVTLAVAPEEHWIAEHHETHAIRRRDDGWIEVDLPVASERWLERLLLALGPAACVVAGPDELRMAAGRAAERILLRYRPS